MNARRASAAHRGKPRSGNADGTLDGNFSDPTSSVNAAIRALVLQTDTKVLIGGFFTNINGNIANHLARLNYDGSIDSTFNPGAAADNNVFAVAETAPG